MNSGPIRSACPDSTRVEGSSSSDPVHDISSTYPSGWASSDQTLNVGFRTRWNSEPGTYRSTMDGPVAGKGDVLAAYGVPAGRMLTQATILARKSRSGSTRWNVTVFESSSTSIPSDRSQVAVSPQSAEPMIDWSPKFEPIKSISSS